MTRLPDPGFEPRIADWLETDPDRAPREVLATVLAAHPSIPQRRAMGVPWRFQTMNRFVLLGATAALVAVVGLGGVLLAGRGPSPAHTPPPSPSPTVQPSVVAPSPSGPLGFDVPYTSDRYGYALRHPSTWEEHPGTVDNAPDTLPSVDENRADFFGDTMSGHGLMVTSAPASVQRPDLASWSDFVGQEAARRYGDYMELPTCAKPTRTLTVDGEPAVEHDFICANHSFMWVAAVHDGRQYQIIWLDDGGLGEDILRPLLDKFLQTFTFAPVASPSPSA